MPEPSTIVGDAPCFCGAPIKVKTSKKNKLYFICSETSEGGCGLQYQCRSPKSEKDLARRITKWVRREDRLAYLGDEALPAKARQPEPEPEIEPEPEELEEEGELEPVEEPPPPPPPQRPTPPKRRPVPPQFQRKTTEKGSIGFMDDE